MNYGRNDESFLFDGQIVIVGASLAGLNAAETLRTEDFIGQLTLIGDEPYEPYDRPPLSKQVLTGWVEAENTALPQLANLGADWRLGVPAARLDLSRRKVDLADGQEVDFDRLLIATGTRARPWPDPQEAALDGVFQLHGRDDAGALQRRLVAQPRHVLVIGAGFLGSERVVAAVSFNQAKWLEFYLAQIETAAPFPPQLETVDQPAVAGVYPADFPDPRLLSHSPLITLTG